MLPMSAVPLASLAPTLPSTPVLVGVACPRAWNRCEAPCGFGSQPVSGPPFAPSHKLGGECSPAAWAGGYTGGQASRWAKPRG